jgi:ABC-type transporter Mla maintaining outer membrane lipid asymmetry permease subunit MlaE
LAGAVGHFIFSRVKALALRYEDQLSFAGRLVLAGLTGNDRQKGRAALSRRLFLTETARLIQTTSVMIIVIGLLAGLLWDGIWFGVLNNIGGSEYLISLIFSVQLQEVTPILATMVITMGHGVPMTVDLALRKSQGEFATLIAQGVPPEHFLAWPRLWTGLVSFPVFCLTLAIFTLVGLYLGIRQFIGLSLWDFLNAAHANLVEFKFLKMGAKCLMVGFCLNFFCLYHSWRVQPGQLRSIPRLARWAMAETFVYSNICVVLATILYD